MHLRIMKIDRCKQKYKVYTRKLIIINFPIELQFIKSNNKAFYQLQKQWLQFPSCDYNMCKFSLAHFMTSFSASKAPFTIYLTFYYFQSKNDFVLIENVLFVILCVNMQQILLHISDLQRKKLYYCACARINMVVL